jgi:hypothetical protein
MAMLVYANALNLSFVVNGTTTITLAFGM